MDMFQCTASRQLSHMVLAILFFHISEYILAVIIHGKRNVTLQSLLISKHYILAMAFSLLEYWIEYSFVPWMKEYWWLSNLGLSLAVIGEIIRKMAILTAGRSFTHLIKIHHEDHHKLITHATFAMVVWRFFARRIPYEENYLIKFFGHEYEQFARRVPSGIPFVR
ncbi:Protein-S-isoprenylcysteine O-methyltransferase B [Bienertia sinuspersici]